MKDKPTKVSLPENFFQTARPTISNKEALRDVIPVEWEEIPNTEKKVIAYSVKEKKA